MNRRLTGLRMVPACAAAFTLVAACGGSDASDDGQVTIACIVKSVQSPFFLETKEGCERAAEAAGAELIFGSGATETDVEGEIREVEDALVKGADAMVIAPTAPDQLQPVLERAAADMPVILLDTDIPNMESKTSYVGTDNIEAGRLGAEYILDQVGSGEFGIVTGDPGITSVDQRVQGAEEAWEGTGIELVQTVVARACARDAGVSATEDLLTANPDLDGIFYVCDQPMLGGVEAIEKAGYTPDDLFVVGFDAEPEAVDLVEQGVVDGDVAQFPYKMGELGVKNAIKALNGGEVPEVIDSGAEVVTKENAADFQ